MQGALNLRWRDRASRWRPAGEVIRTDRYDVVELPGDREPKAFVEAHHYSGSYAPARFRFGLYDRDGLAGVAVFGPGIADATRVRLFGGAPAESAELVRFVLLDSVPGNGETWFLARCFEHLRRIGLRGVLSHSDPVPRTTAAGVTVFPGHVGTIYQAHNAVYLGRATARLHRVLPDGTLLSPRLVSKVRGAERGWAYGVRALCRYGAEAPAPDADLRAWLAEQLPRITRPLRHRGNHRYAWSLDRRVQLPAGSLYPKATG